MRFRIPKWANSLALRIPKVFAAEVRLEQDKFVEVSLVEGKLVIAPVVEPGGPSGNHRPVPYTGVVLITGVADPFT